MKIFTVLTVVTVAMNLVTGCATGGEPPEDIKQNATGGVDARTNITSVHFMESRMLKVGQTDDVSPNTQVQITLVKVAPADRKAFFKVRDRASKRVQAGWIEEGQTFKAFPRLGRSGVILKKVNTNSVLLEYHGARSTP